MDDYFQSNIFSLIFVWILFVLSVPFTIISILIGTKKLFEKTEGVPRAFKVWLLLCILLFSPLRYILFQVLIGLVYPFQSLYAFYTTFILGLYIPIVFGILYIIAFLLPFGVSLAIAGFKDSHSRIRLWMSALAAPILFLIAGYLYYLLLPVAAYSTHWLNARDVIRATNGPSEYVFRYIAEPLTPIAFPGYVGEMGFDNLTPKERLRAHVASLYLGDKQFSLFMYKSYPEEFKRQTGYQEP